MEAAKSSVSSDYTVQLPRSHLCSWFWSRLRNWKSWLVIRGFQGQWWRIIFRQDMTMFCNGQLNQISSLSNPQCSRYSFSCRTRVPYCKFTLGAFTCLRELTLYYLLGILEDVRLKIIPVVSTMILTKKLTLQTHDSTASIPYKRT